MNKHLNGMLFQSFLQERMPRKGEEPEIAARNKTVTEVHEQGSKVWKKNNAYHRRSLAETAMFRIKILFGDHLKACKFESQAVEAFVRCVVLNRMTALGMPESCPI